jgi:hypothetical protein
MRQRLTALRLGTARRPLAAAAVVEAAVALLEAVVVALLEAVVVALLRRAKMARSQ